MTNLEHHLTEFSRAANERIEIVQHLQDLRKQIPRWGGFHDHARFVRDERAAIAQIEPDLSSMYRRLGQHGMAAVERAHDPELRRLISEMLKLGAEEAKYTLHMIRSLENAGNLAGFLSFAAERLRSDAERQKRLAEFESKTVDLTAYCLLHFPPAEDAG